MDEGKSCILVRLAWTFPKREARKPNPKKQMREKERDRERALGRGFE